MEIWDYKGTRLPDLSSAEMRDYVWQMCAYAELYRERAGTYPARAILYFLNDLDLDPEPTAAVKDAAATAAASAEPAQSVLCVGHVRQFGGESPLCNLIALESRAG